MLQRVDAIQDGAADYDERDYGGALSIDPSAILAFLRRHIAIILAGTALGGLLALSYLAATPALYQARASLLVDSRENPIFQGQLLNAEAPLDTARVDSQVEVILSDAIIGGVIDQLSLMEDPEFGGVTPAGDPTFVDQIQEFIFGPPVVVSSSNEDVRRRVISAVSKRVSASRRGLTYVIDTRFESVDPQKAALIANAFPEVYIDNELNARLDSARRTSEWLQEQIEELRQRALAADRAVQVFKADNDIVRTGETLINEQALSEVNTQLVEARAARAEAEATLNQIRSVLSTPEAIVEGGIPEALNNSVISQLRQQYNELSSRAASLRTRLGAGHSAVQNVEADMGQTLSAIQGELQRIAGVYESNFEIAQAREDSLEGIFSQNIERSNDVNVELVTLRNLESEAETARALYDNFLLKSMETSQQETFPTVNARVISPAQVPIAKSSPNRKLVLTSGLMLGFAFVREQMDSSLRTAAQVRSKLGLPLLAYVPRLARPKRFKSATVEGDQRVLPQRIGPYRSILNDPPASFVDAISAMKFEIEQAHRDRNLSVVSVTAITTGTGKSFLNANLAQMLAHQGHKVLLVDLALRRATLSGDLVSSPELDVTDVMAKRATLEDAVWIDPVTGLNFLPACVIDDVASSELLSGDTLRAFVDAARAQFDFVILDMPALIPLSDARTAAPVVDGFVFALDWGHTTADAALQVLNGTPLLAKKTIGAVLNRTELNRLWRYDSRLGTELGKAYGLN